MENLELIAVAVILIVGTLIALFFGYKVGIKLTEARYNAQFDKWIMEKEKEIREDAVKRSRLTLGGKFSEQLAPYLPSFAYDPTEARFIGSPIDLIVFRGLATDAPEEIVLMEIKRGDSQLTSRERKIKELVEHKRVRWELYRIPANDS